ncbi:TraB/GumN family protein, partial [Halobium palmae]
DSSSVDSLNALTARCLSVEAIRSFRRRVEDDDSRARLRAAMADVDDLDDAYGLSSGSTEEQVEALETMPIADLERLVDAVETLLPAATGVMLRERNEYMAGRLHWLREAGESVVAVVGPAHVPGLRTLLDDPGSIPSEHVVEPRTVRFVDG